MPVGVTGEGRRGQRCEVLIRVEKKQSEQGRVWKRKENRLKRMWTSSLAQSSQPGLSGCQVSSRGGREGRSGPRVPNGEQNALRSAGTGVLWGQG